MRSTEPKPTIGHDSGSAARFGEIIRHLATAAGYDVTSGSGGRAALARDIGSMSPSSVARMLDGKTLPLPHHLEAIARVLKADVRDLLIRAGVLTKWPKDADQDVLSATSRSPHSPSPEDVADMWGITEPGIRSMLISSAEHAIRLQEDADARRAAEGEAVGRK